MAEINHDVFIYANVQTIFNAISLPEKINLWWTKECSGIPRLGSVYNFYFSDEFNWFGTVHSFEANQEIRWIMTKSDDDWDNTIFGFKLISESKVKTRVKFSHHGWKTGNEHFRQTSFCWAMYLYLLKKFIENQEVTLFEDRIYT
jgi:uncharacterized protein YndB with AHSA1/START domain